VQVVAEPGEMASSRRGGGGGAGGGAGAGVALLRWRGELHQVRPVRLSGQAAPARLPFMLAAGSAVTDSSRPSTATARGGTPRPFAMPMPPGAGRAGNARPHSARARAVSTAF